MLIAVNAGNNHVLLGGYEGDEQTFAASIATDTKQTGDFYACTLKQVLALHGVDTDRITGAIISSVVPPMTAVLEYALHLIGVDDVLEVSSGIKTGLNIRSDQPRQVGADRVANAVAAKERGKLPCVIVIMGTATTFTVLDEAGSLTASAITAGVRLSLSALRQTAAQLPAVAIEAQRNNVLARNTADAMCVGAVYGAAAMVDGMVQRFSEALGQTPHVYLTGGSAPLIERYLRVPYERVDSLCLEGLRLIWKKNRA